VPGPSSTTGFLACDIVGHRHKPQDDCLLFLSHNVHSFFCLQCCYFSPWTIDFPGNHGFLPRNCSFGRIKFVETLGCHSLLFLVEWTKITKIIIICFQGRHHCPTTVGWLFYFLTQGSVPGPSSTTGFLACNVVGHSREPQYDCLLSFIQQCA